MTLDTARPPVRDPEPALLELLGRATGGDPGRRPQVEDLRAHSNHVVRVALVDGRALVVKRGRHPWSSERFAAARAAARLLRRRTGIVVPEHLPLPASFDGRALEVYWWIALPTLKQLWPGLPEAERPRVLRSWGELARRLHGVRLPGSGRVPGAARSAGSLADYLVPDVATRLLPAVRGVWPAAAAGVEALRRFVPAVVARVAGPGGSLLHNDLHMGNVLCRWEGRRLRCVGVLDLEDALAGPPEIDVARLEVLHGPWLGQALPVASLDQLRRGYDRVLDPALLAFFRAYHLANIGFHAALVGYADQARRLAGALRAEAARLPAALRGPVPRREPAPRRRPAAAL